MAAAGTSRPCSGAEHLISHSLDAMLGEHAGLHGHQVALGSLITAAAHDSPLLDGLQRLFTRLGLPTCPEDLGLSPDLLAEAIRRAPGMRPERYTVLSQLGRGIPDAEELIRRGCLPSGVSAAL
jgi:glycerol-1-phosphate dehydrogenase [NAD(P)+]